MNVAELKTKIFGDEYSINKLLEDAGFCNIHQVNSKEIRCAIDEGSNDSSVAVNINTLKSAIYSKNVSGDIVTILGWRLNLNFKDTFKWMCKTLGYSATMTPPSEVNLPFGGFWKKFNGSSSEIVDDNYETYDIEEIIKEYGIRPTRRFIKDEISIQTQEKFGIGYDVLTDRITVPWFDLHGNLIGIMGRYNGDDYEEKTQAKWFPIIPFEKSRFLLDSMKIIILL